MVMKVRWLYSAKDACVVTGINFLKKLSADIILFIILGISIEKY